MTILLSQEISLRLRYFKKNRSTQYNLCKITESPEVVNLNLAETEKLKISTEETVSNYEEMQEAVEEMADEHAVSLDDLADPAEITINKRLMESVHKPQNSYISLGKVRQLLGCLESQERLHNFSKHLSMRGFDSFKDDCNDLKV